VSKEKAQALLSRSDANYREVVRPYLDGDDIAEDPKQAPRRWIIDFAKLPLEGAMKYPAVLRAARDRLVCSAYASHADQRARRLLSTTPARCPRRLSFRLSAGAYRRQCVAEADSAHDRTRVLNERFIARPIRAYVTWPRGVVPGHGRVGVCHGKEKVYGSIP